LPERPGVGRIIGNAARRVIHLGEDGARQVRVASPATASSTSPPGWRSKIVYGAVGMVEMALNGLAERGLLQLDDERKAAMVSNLLVVLCSDHDATPVVNAGTLYN
jgi:hypothetical protein